jgi:uncharacterized protein YqgV (UPF0045/DUF77 family)
MMRAAVEISMYPLAHEYRPLIRDFIRRLNQHPQMIVRTNALSTQIWGELDQVMQLLTVEMAHSAAGGPQLVFVLKVLPGIAPPPDLA